MAHATRTCTLRASKMGDDDDTLVAIKFEVGENRLDPKDLIASMLHEAEIEPGEDVTLSVRTGIPAHTAVQSDEGAEDEIPDIDWAKEAHNITVPLKDNKDYYYRWYVAKLVTNLHRRLVKVEGRDKVFRELREMLDSWLNLGTNVIEVTEILTFLDENKV